SDQPVAFQFPSGERRSNNPIDHAQVAYLVKEIAPADTVEQLRRDGRASFSHATAEMEVEVSVDARAAREWRVEIRPAAARPARPMAAAVGIVDRGVEP